MAGLWLCDPTILCDWLQVPVPVWVKVRLGASTWEADLVEVGLRLSEPEEAVAVAVTVESVRDRVSVDHVEEELGLQAVTDILRVKLQVMLAVKVGRPVDVDVADVVAEDRDVVAVGVSVAEGGLGLGVPVRLKDIVCVKLRLRLCVGEPDSVPVPVRVGPGEGVSVTVGLALLVKLGERIRLVLAVGVAEGVRLKLREA